MALIHELLNQRPFYYTAAEIARLLETPKRTIEHDLYVMKSWQMPIGNCKAKGGYHFTEAEVPMPLSRFGETDAGSLVLVRTVLGVLSGTRVGESAARSLDKVISRAGGNVRERARRVGDIIHLRGLRPIAPMDYELFQLLLDCCLDFAKIEIDYGRPQDKERRRHFVQPRALVGAVNGWYLLIDDRKSPGKLINFALSRIKRARLTGERFVPVPVDVQAHFAHSIGIFGGGDPTRVRLRFNLAAGRIATEQRPHESVVSTELADGRIEMTLNVSLNKETEAWIFGWSKEVEVIEPPELRARRYDDCAAIMVQGREFRG